MYWFSNQKICEFEREMNQDTLFVLKRRLKYYFPKKELVCFLNHFLSENAPNLNQYTKPELVALGYELIRDLEINIS